jgi:hypothetical protein
VKASRTARTVGNLREEAFAVVGRHVQRYYRSKQGIMARYKARRRLRRLHEAQQVLEAGENVVLRDALSPEGVSRDAAREDGDAPHPAAAGGVDIRVPIPDVDSVLPWDRERGKDGVEGLGVGLGVAALPRAGRREPLRMQFT